MCGCVCAWEEARAATLRHTYHFLPGSSNARMLRSTRRYSDTADAGALLLIGLDEAEGGKCCSRLLL